MVGAGPSGSTAAYFLARAGLEVVLLERGPFPGSKNMGGATLFGRPTNELFPGFWEEAPLERVLVDVQYWILTEDSAARFATKSRQFVNPPFNRITIIRSKFDAWLANKAAGAGATLLTGHKADGLLFRGQKAVGVRLAYPQDGDLYADVVILADGSNSLLGSQAGVIPKIKAKDMSLYVKETIALPAGAIEERFNVGPREGVGIGLGGYNTAGLVGTSSLHTYTDSVGINVGIIVDTLKRCGLNPNDLLDRIKAHPAMAPLIAGGPTVEYTAHLIPDGGYNAIPKLVHDGILIVGDAAGLVNGTHGINLAMFSGKFAAEAVIEAKRKKDFSAASLSLYQKLLDQSFVLQDLRKYRNVPAFYSSHPYVFHLYSRKMVETALEVASVYPIPLDQKRRLIWGKMKSMQPPVRILKDAHDAWKVTW